MRIIIITQNDPFYLAENLDYLFSNIPSFANIVGCVVSDVSPFGKKEGMVDKAIKTLKIFGIRFFLRYSIRYMGAKFNPKKNVLSVLDKHDIQRIKLYSSINSEASLMTIKNFNPDLLISIAGNEIFKLPLIELAPAGCLNLHTALLPKYRGLMPSFWVLKNNENETGVSVFYVDEGIDSGPILVQKRMPISGMSQEQLISISKKLGMDAIVEAIDKIHRNDVSTIDNADIDMTYYRFPSRSDVKEFLSNGARFF